MVRLRPSPSGYICAAGSGQWERDEARWAWPPRTGLAVKYPPFRISRATSDTLSSQQPSSTDVFNRAPLRQQDSTQDLDIFCDEDSYSCFRATTWPATTK
ncbi:hypothetical protein ILUMI_15248 [Ignelater luminosus]|uniref:Uncharacterized protein n=1 Tax=Ignelater luminosus TaxID=2038154 RepID=A0A8K0G422_IGNLU|nr:hypothetical protein ILUMI_15248 [Ignelater luminosus]